VSPGLIEGFVETANGRLTIVGIFAVGIGVMDDEAETRPRTGGGPLDHLQVAVGVAESGDGPPADVHLNADGFTRLVVDKVDFRQPHQHGRAVAQLETGLDAAADDLLGRNAVDLFRPGAHELDAAAGHDISLESVGRRVQCKAG